MFFRKKIIIVIAVLAFVAPMVVFASFGAGDFVDNTTYSGGAGFFGFLRRVGGQAFNPGYTSTIEGLTQTEQKNVLIIIAANVINIFLSVLGVVLVIFFFYGGFIWLKSRGNTEEIERAQKILSSAIIGLVIILATYAIASFVVRSFRGATLSPSQEVLEESGFLP